MTEREKDFLRQMRPVIRPWLEDGVARLPERERLPARVRDDVLARTRVPDEAPKVAWSTGLATLVGGSRTTIAAMFIALAGGLLVFGFLAGPSQETTPTVGSPPRVTDTIEVWVGAFDREPGCCAEETTAMVAAGDAVWVAGSSYPINPGLDSAEPIPGAPPEVGAVARIDPATRQVSHVIEIGPTPSQLVPTGDALFVLADQAFVRIDLDDPAGEPLQPVGMVMHTPIVRDGSMWVHSHANEWVEVDLADPSRRTAYSMPGVIGGATWAAQIDGALWSVHPDMPALARFDLESRQHTDTVPLRAGGQYGLNEGPWPMSDCCVATDDAIWIVQDNPADQNREVARFDVSTREFSGDAHVGYRLGKGLYANGALWIPTDPPGPDELLRIDPRTRELTDRIPSHKMLSRPVLSGGSIWSEYSGELSQINVETRRHLGTTSVPGADDSIEIVAHDGAIWLPHGRFVTRVETGVPSPAGPDPVNTSKEDTVKLRTPAATALVLMMLATPAASAIAQSALEAAPEAPIEVTGTWRLGPCVVDGVDVGNEDTEMIRGEQCQPSWDLSDDRLNGTLTWETNKDLYPGDEVEVTFGALSVENAGGTWRQMPVTTIFAELPYSVENPKTEGDVIDEVRVFKGEGDHHGLVAVIELISETELRPITKLHGYIFSQLPPLPETAATS